jgi:outer membrane protein TolC
VALTSAVSIGIAGRAAAQYAGTEPDTSYLAGEMELHRLGLTLEQAKQLGAEHSPVSRAAMGAYRSARGARLREAGTFDPVLFGASERVSTDIPVSSPFAGSETRQRSLTGGLSWLSPIGTQVDVGLSQIQTESNAPFATLPRERRARARVDFVQPLLRGFGTAAARGELRAADRELEAARLQLEAARRDVDAEVETAYWQLYAAERNLEVQRLQRQRAAAFLRQQILRGRAGAASPGAVAIARTFLADQEAILLDTRLLLEAASNRFAEAVGQPAESLALYHALDAPPPPTPAEPLPVLLARALEASPELLAADQVVMAAEARYRRAARNAWPTVEAFGGYGGSGLAGTGRTVVFGADTVGANFDTDFDRAWDQVFGDDFPDWNVGVRVNVPLFGWRSDRGERERRLGLLEGARAGLLARRLALESQVRNNYLEVELAGRQLDAMRELVAAAHEQARIARLEYQAGRTTAYEVVNLEADLARAQFRESEALVRVARASTELRRLTTPAPRGGKR